MMRVVRDGGGSWLFFGGAENPLIQGGGEEEGRRGKGFGREGERILRERTIQTPILLYSTRSFAGNVDLQ